MKYPSALFWKWWNTQLIDKQWYILFPNHLFWSRIASLSALHASFHTMWFKCLLCSCVCLSPRLMKGRVTGELIALPRTWGETRAGGTWLALTLHSADSLHFPSPVALFVSLREGGRRVVGVGRVNWGYTHTSRIKRLTKSKMLKSDFSPTAPQGF